MPDYSYQNVPTATLTGPQNGGDRERYIPARIRNLEKAIAYLHETISTLDKRLEPVLMPSVPPINEQAADRPTLPPLVENLDYNEARILDAVKRIESILERLEL